MANESDSTKQSVFSIRFLVWWVIVNTITVDLAIGGAAIFILATLLAGGGFNFILTMMLVLPGMLFIGAGQWGVLRKHISKPGRWILANILAGMVGVITAQVIILLFNLEDSGLFEGLAISYGVSLVVAGLIHGFLLSRQTSGVSWILYPLATVIGSMVSYLWSYGLLQVSNTIFDPNIFIIAIVIAASVLIGSLYAAVTGVTLWWLLKPWQPKILTVHT